MAINQNSQPLPVSWDECQERGWESLDILLVTGDYYIDHPAFGVALIGRLLEKHGYRVAILSQPRITGSNDFSAFPPPQLFCGITAGNLDSLVANYTGNKRVRDTDSYSPGGNPWRGKIRSRTERLRPDRASLVYTNLAKAAYKNTPIILGGIEASLRRFVHYDYIQDKLRPSFLTDAKADLLVYGMGERAIVEIARRCKHQLPLTGITGTCERRTKQQMETEFPELPFDKAPHIQLLPSWDSITREKKLFLDAELIVEKHSRAQSSQLLLQQQKGHWVIQNSPAKPLDPVELDSLYTMPFTRKPHPPGDPPPAYKMIKDSVTIVRGCAGNCSFCAITRHQGPASISRSITSIRDECKLLVRQKGFSGTISDLGGPTANLYGTSCKIGSCKKHDCLHPTLCPQLNIDEDRFLALLAEVGSIEGVKHLFISSGLRMELLLKTPRLLKKLLADHTPGSLKIAPEHTDDQILAIMHKEPHSVLEKFVKACRKICRERNMVEVKLTPYVISSHPGATPYHAEKLSRDMSALGLYTRRSQDFTPTPGTLSTAMYVTGLSRLDKKPFTVARKKSQRAKQRNILEKKKVKRRFRR